MRSFISKTGWPVLVIVCLMFQGCTPNLPIGGTYFPAWLVCLTTGLIATLLIRLGLIGAGLDQHLSPRLLAYPALMIAITLLVWLCFYPR